MKKFMLVLILVSAMAMGLASSSHAVQLQQGWYAWFAAYLETDDPDTGPYTADWHPTSSLGQTGPLLVSLWAGYPSIRMVTVTATTSVSPGVLFEDVGSYSGGGIAYRRVYASWETDYLAGNMRLQLLRRRSGQQDELAWQQVLSGHQVGDGGNIWHSSPVVPGDQLVFRVVAVPEPSSLLALGSGLLALGGLIRRRR